MLIKASNPGFRVRGEALRARVTCVREIFLAYLGISLIECAVCFRPYS